MVPIHYQNQCYFLISKILWNFPQNNFTASAQAIILYKAFKKDILKWLPHKKTSELTQDLT